MHIALYSPAWPVEDYQNGIVTYVKHMREGLMALGHEVTVVAGAVGPSNRDANIHKVEWPRKTLRTRLMRRLGLHNPLDFGRPIAETIRKIHGTSPIDLIEMEESFGLSLEVQSLGIPMVVKLHGPAFLSLVEEELNSNLSRAKIKREGEALAAAHFITSPSVGTLEDTVARYTLSAKTAHARNPVDPSTMPVWDVDTASEHAALFIGRFDKRKGGDTVLRAFRLVLQRIPDALLIFVGPDRGLTQADGSMIHFEQYVGELFTADERTRIKYSGALEPEHIEQLRLKARVTVVASRWESAGYTAMEAMAQGCPVAALDCGGVREVVMRDKTGLLSGSIDELADDIVQLMHDPLKAASLGRQARQFMFDTHSPKIVVDAAAKFYAEVVGEALSRI